MMSGFPGSHGRYRRRGEGSRRRFGSPRLITGKVLPREGKHGGARVRARAASHASFVSSASAGRITCRLGMARAEARCSTGWCVGPSSPTKKESWVKTYMACSFARAASRTGGPHVVQEGKEGGGVGDDAAVVGHAVLDGAHGVLAYPEVDVPADLSFPDSREALHEGLVAGPQVRRSAGEVRAASLNRPPGLSRWRSAWPRPLPGQRRGAFASGASMSGRGEKAFHRASFSPVTDALKAVSSTRSCCSWSSLFRSLKISYTRWGTQKFRPAASRCSSWSPPPPLRPGARRGIPRSLRFGAPFGDPGLRDDDGGPVAVSAAAFNGLLDRREIVAVDLLHVPVRTPRKRFAMSSEKARAVSPSMEMSLES